MRTNNSPDSAERLASQDKEASPIEASASQPGRPSDSEPTIVFPDSLQANTGTSVSTNFRSASQTDTEEVEFNVSRESMALRNHMLDLAKVMRGVAKTSSAMTGRDNVEMNVSIVGEYVGNHHYNDMIWDVDYHDGRMDIVSCCIPFAGGKYLVAEFYCSDTDQTAVVNRATTKKKIGDAVAAEFLAAGGSDE